MRKRGDESRNLGNTEKLKLRFLNKRGGDTDTPKVESEKRAVLVMGGTGLVGGAVVRGLLSYPWFHVLVATRRPWCADAALLKQAGATLVEVDFNYKHSLSMAMRDVKCVFMHTNYWENYSCTMEIVHGKNAVEAAVEAGVEHLVYDGTNYRKPDEGRVCAFLRSRLEIEEIIKQSGLSYTIVVLPFYFENFLTVFRPYEIHPDLFALMLPLENCFISCACLHDMALCICKIIQQSKFYIGQKLSLAAEMLSLQQMITVFNTHLSGFDFIDPEITVQEFMEFEFLGAKDLATMFLFYQVCEDIPDFSLGDFERGQPQLVTKTLNPNTRTMTQWIADNKAQLYSALDEPALAENDDFIRPPHLRRTSPSDEGISSTNLDDDLDEDSLLEVPARSLIELKDDEGSNQSNNSDGLVKEREKASAALRIKAQKHRAALKMMSQARFLAVQKFLQEDFATISHIHHRSGALTEDEHDVLPVANARSKKRGFKALSKLHSWLRGIFHGSATMKSEESGLAQGEDDGEADSVIYTADRSPGRSSASIASKSWVHIGKLEIDKPGTPVRSRSDLHTFLDAYVNMKSDVATLKDAETKQEEAGLVDEVPNTDDLEKEARVARVEEPAVPLLACMGTKRKSASDLTPDAVQVTDKEQVLPDSTDSTSSSQTTHNEGREPAPQLCQENSANGKTKSSTMSWFSVESIPQATETTRQKESTVSTSSLPPVYDDEGQPGNLSRKKSSSVSMETLWTKKASTVSIETLRARHEDMEPPLLMWPESMDTQQTEEMRVSCLNSQSLHLEKEHPLLVSPETSTKKNDSTFSTLSSSWLREDEEQPLLVLPATAVKAKEADSTMCGLSSESCDKDEEPTVSVKPESMETPETGKETDRSLSTLHLRTPHGHQGPSPLICPQIPKHAEADSTALSDLAPVSAETKVPKQESQASSCSSEIAAGEPQLDILMDKATRRRRSRLSSKPHLPLPPTCADEEGNFSNNGSGIDSHAYVPFRGQSLPAYSNVLWLGPILHETYDTGDAGTDRPTGSRGYPPFRPGQRASPPVCASLLMAESVLDFDEDFCLPGYTGVEERKPPGKEGSGRRPLFVSAASPMDLSFRKGRGPTCRAPQGRGQDSCGGGSTMQFSSDKPGPGVTGEGGRRTMAGAGNNGGGFMRRISQGKRSEDSTYYTKTGMKRAPSAHRNNLHEYTHITDPARNNKTSAEPEDPAYYTKTGQMCTPSLYRNITHDLANNAEPARKSTPFPKPDLSAYYTRTGLKRTAFPHRGKAYDSAGHRLERPLPLTTPDSAYYFRSGHRRALSPKTQYSEFYASPREESRGRPVLDDSDEQVYPTLRSYRDKQRKSKALADLDNTKQTGNAVIITGKGKYLNGYDHEVTDERQSCPGWVNPGDEPLRDSSYAHPTDTDRYVIDFDDVPYQLHLNMNICTAVMSRWKTKNPSQLVEIISEHNRRRQERRSLSPSGYSEKITKSPSPSFLSSADTDSSAMLSIGEANDAAFHRNKQQFLRYALGDGGEIPEDLLFDTFLWVRPAHGGSESAGTGSSTDVGIDEDESLEVIMYHSPEV